MVYKDNFGIYSSREVQIFKHFVETNPWFEAELVNFRPDNTGFHDLKCLLKNGACLVVEIKEEERYWYNRTGNLGLDYISAFHFNQKRDFWLQNNYWIQKYHYTQFLQDITVSKWGKLITCDADVQLFYVQDQFCQMYSNAALQHPDFVAYLNTHYNLRINKKSDYQLADDWESAAYYIPIGNPRLNNAKITQLTNLIAAVAANQHGVNRAF
ncbi:MAG TPA: hypothetical protein PK239_13695 [Chitinophagales bacterium]|nr:hypothetical protein [Chitinophagales bacterium]